MFATFQYWKLRFTKPFFFFFGKALCKPHMIHVLLCSYYIIKLYILPFDIFTKITQQSSPPTKTTSLICRIFKTRFKKFNLCLWGCICSVVFVYAGVCEGHRWMLGCPPVAFMSFLSVCLSMYLPTYLCIYHLFIYLETGSLTESGPCSSVRLLIKPVGTACLSLPVLGL